MTTGDLVLFAGEVVIIRSIHVHAVTGRPRYLIEHPDKTFSGVCAESLAPLEEQEEPAAPASIEAFLRQPTKRKIVLK